MRRREEAEREGMTGIEPASSVWKTFPWPIRGCSRLTRSNPSVTVPASNYGDIGQCVSGQFRSTAVTHVEARDRSEAPIEALVSELENEATEWLSREEWKNIDK